MATLADHANVSDTALIILQKKGYQLWQNSESNTYYAEKDGWDFASNSLVGLLGVVAIFEFTRPPVWREYWWKEPSDSCLFLRLPEAPPRPYEPVYVTAKKNMPSP